MDMLDSGPLSKPKKSHIRVLGSKADQDDSYGIVYQKRRPKIFDLQVTNTILPADLLLQNDDISNIGGRGESIKEIDYAFKQSFIPNSEVYHDQYPRRQRTESEYSLERSLQRRNKGSLLQQNSWNDLKGADKNCNKSNISRVSKKPSICEKLFEIQSSRDREKNLNQKGEGSGYNGRYGHDFRSGRTDHNAHNEPKLFLSDIHGIGQSEVSILQQTEKMVWNTKRPDLKNKMEVANDLWDRMKSPASSSVTSPAGLMGKSHAKGKDTSKLTHGYAQGQNIVLADDCLNSQHCQQYGHSGFPQQQQSFLREESIEEDGGLGTVFINQGGVARMNGSGNGNKMSSHLPHQKADKSTNYDHHKMNNNVLTDNFKSRHNHVESNSHYGENNGNRRRSPISQDHSLLESNHKFDERKPSYRAEFDILPIPSRMGTRKGTGTGKGKEMKTIRDGKDAHQVKDNESFHRKQKQKQHKQEESQSIIHQIDDEALQKEEMHDGAHNIMSAFRKKTILEGAKLTEKNYPIIHETTNQLVPSLGGNRDCHDEVILKATSQIEITSKPIYVEGNCYIAKPYKNGDCLQNKIPFSKLKQSQPETIYEEESSPEKEEMSQNTNSRNNQKGSGNRNKFKTSRQGRPQNEEKKHSLYITKDPMLQKKAKSMYLHGGGSEETKVEARVDRERKMRRKEKQKQQREALMVDKFKLINMALYMNLLNFLQNNMPKEGETVKGKKSEIDDECEQFREGSERSRSNGSRIFTQKFKDMNDKIDRNSRKPEDNKNYEKKIGQQQGKTLRNSHEHELESAYTPLHQPHQPHQTHQTHLSHLPYQPQSPQSPPLSNFSTVQLQSINQHLLTISLHLQNQLPSIRRQLHRNQSNISQLQSDIHNKNESNQLRHYRILKKMKLQETELLSKQRDILEHEVYIDKYKQELMEIKEEIRRENEEFQFIEKEVYYEGRLEAIKRYNQILCEKIIRENEKEGNIQRGLEDRVESLERDRHFIGHIEHIQKQNKEIRRDDEDDEGGESGDRSESKDDSDGSHCEKSESEQQLETDYMNCESTHEQFRHRSPKGDMKGRNSNDIIQDLNVPYQQPHPNHHNLGKFLQSGLQHNQTDKLSEIDRNLLMLEEFRRNKKELKLSHKNNIPQRHYVSANLLHYQRPQPVGYN